MEHQQQGVLVLDGEGKTVFASGSGADPAVQGTLSRIWKARGAQPVAPMFTLNALSLPITALCHASGSTGCFLLFATGHGDTLYEFVSSVAFAPDILRHFITNPYEAITVVDAHGKLRYISPVHERFFGFEHGQAIGRDVTEVIENSRLRTVAKTGKAEIGHVQRMRGTSRVVSRTPIQNAEGEIVGAIGQVMFKSPAALEGMTQEIHRLRHELSNYERALSGLRHQAHGLDALVGNSEAMRKLKDQIRKVAPLQVSVLLVGESGVGKDLVASALHHAGSRSNREMVLINAAAIPANLVEAELFGYEGGAFTGAEKRGRPGKFEQAHQSSLFLDEIGDMPLDIQVKLLRTLQDGTFQRVGSSQQRHSDFRLISASNRDFRQMLSDYTFRLDLFYRISAVTIRVPPLRERLDDIPLLAQTFLDRFAARHQLHGKAFARGVLAHLKSLPWPGNVRQLQHTVERAAIFSEGELITPEDCEVSVETEAYALPVGSSPDTSGPAALRSPLHPGGMRQARTHIEQEMIRDALARFKGNKKKAAEHLGMSRSQLYKRLGQLQDTPN